MMASLGVGIGCGLVSALLFGVMTTGTPLGVLLSYFAPLPIFIAAVGWPHRTGLLAACVGIAVSTVAIRWSAGLAYGVSLGLPAWWLGYLAMLGRPMPDGKSEWYPTGRLLLWIVAIAAVVTILVPLAQGSSLAAYREAMRRILDAALRGEAGADVPLNLPEGVSQDDVIAVIVAAIPIISAMFFVPIQAFNLWLAGKVVALSGRLARPWPQVSDTLMPRFALALLVAGVGLALLGDGLVSFVAQALCGALAAAFALQGLGALHALTRDKPARPAILGGVYLLLAILNVWMLPLLALGGAVDTLLQRGRTAPPPLKS
ncbi:DUF2232 domain-containing protein [Chelatococcus reniformis]|nr:DUF2232 domain-containing protein [Chelatococcus reniformis]